MWQLSGLQLLMLTLPSLPLMLLRLLGEIVEAVAAPAILPSASTALATVGKLAGTSPLAAAAGGVIAAGIMTAPAAVLLPG